MLANEKELILLAQRGDSEAFSALYDYYLKPIYRFIAIKVSIRQEAEDLVHEVFLSAWQNLPGYKQKGFPFSSWLYRIARNRVIDHYRTGKKNVSMDNPDLGLDQILEDLSEPHGDSLDKRFAGDRVSEAMKQLSPVYYEVLFLRFVEDYSPKEIAEIVGKREGAVRIIQHRAVKQLKEILEK